jgi:glutathione peroxidase
MEKTRTNAYDYKAILNEGEEISLERFKGKKLLIVNTASECYFTPQYLELQALYEQFSSEGFEVLAFPCNDFGGQEPGDNKQIKQFCNSMFGITFPLFEKVNVLGENAHPLFRFLQNKHTTCYSGKDIEWNFTKFLINREGEPEAMISSAVSPLDEQISKWIIS